MLAIQLLGRPALRLDGHEVDAPRDRKTWGLLAYLALADHPPPRQRLAELLFPHVDDPLAGVRWSLTQVRRLLGGSVVLGGDPVDLTLPPDTTVDVDLVMHGRWNEAVLLPPRHELLEGLTFGSAPAFELWLTGARRRVRAAVAAVLHEAALASLAGRPGRSVQFAERLLEVDPYDENHHALLIRALVSAGRTTDAAERAREGRAFLTRELGVQPTGALRTALSSATPRPSWTPTRASVLAQLEAGEAAVGAGSWATAIEHLRQAVAGARQVSDELLRSRCLVALGSALVHAAQGHDEEGAASLHEGGHLAETWGDRSLAASAWRELAWVEFLRARRDRARRWLDRARAAADRPEDTAWIHLTSGALHSDAGDYAAARHDLHHAIAVADDAALTAPGAFARSLLGRTHLLRDELDEARQALQAALDQARAIGWTSFLPWPESLLAEVELRSGDPQAAEGLYEHAFAMGRQLGDPCWESMGARGLGLVALRRGDLAGGVRLLEEAPVLCRRLPDSYLWVEAYGMEALCEVGVEHQLPSASRWIAELEGLAARGGFRELGSLALYHRARSGDHAAADAARAALGRIDNPYVERRISGLTLA